MYIKLFLPCLFFLILLCITKPCLNTCILRVHVQMNCIKALYLLVQFCLSQWTSKDILTQSIHAPSSQRLKKPITRGRGGGYSNYSNFFLYKGGRFFIFTISCPPSDPKMVYVINMYMYYRSDGNVTLLQYICLSQTGQYVNYRMFCMLTSVE